jgi:hypothetical protein
VFVSSRRFSRRSPVSRFLPAVRFTAALALIALAAVSCRQLSMRGTDGSATGGDVLWSGAVTDSSARVVARLPDSLSDRLIRLTLTSGGETPEWKETRLLRVIIPTPRSLRLPPRVGATRLVRRCLRLLQRQP